MSASQLMAWMEYDRLEPFGSWRDNYHAALIASILANVHRDPKSRPLRMDEFFYQDAETASEQSDNEMLAWLDAVSKKAE